MYINEQKKAATHNSQNEMSFRYMTAKDKEQMVNKKTASSNVDKCLKSFGTFMTIGNAFPVEKIK